MPGLSTFRPLNLPYEKIRSPSHDATITRITISTGGGDAPGLNAVIRAEVLGVFRITLVMLWGIGRLDGTILGITYHGNPLRFATRMPEGSTQEIDRNEEIIAHLNKLDIESLVCITVIAHSLW